MYKWKITFLTAAAAFALLYSFPALAQENDGSFVNAASNIQAVDGPVVEAIPGPGVSQEVSLGIFKITGYCSCDICSAGHELTYSGTVPKANHTIDADLTLFPVGTRLRINDIIYTVEDKGSSVKGNTLDIYYDTHEEALANGVYDAEVFLVQ